MNPDARIITNDTIVIPKDVQRAQKEGEIIANAIKNGIVPVGSDAGNAADLKRKTLSSLGEHEKEMEKLAGEIEGGKLAIKQEEKLGREWDKIFNMTMPVTPCFLWRFNCRRRVFRASRKANAFFDTVVTCC